MKNIRTGLVDPDTPESAMTKKSADGKTLKLVVCAEDTVDGGVCALLNVWLVLGRVQ